MLPLRKYAEKAFFFSALIFCLSKETIPNKYPDDVHSTADGDCSSEYLLRGDFHFDIPQNV